MKTLLSILLALLLYAPEAASQHSGHSRGSSTGHGNASRAPAPPPAPAPAAPGTSGNRHVAAMACPAMLMLRPAGVVERREELRLSAEQVRSLESMASLDSVITRHHHEAMRRHQELGELMRSPAADMASVEALIRQAGEHMVQAHLVAARRSGEIRARLSQQQWDALVSAGMAPCPMMGHGEPQGTHQHPSR